MTPINAATREPFDFPPNTDELTYRGVTYHFRELTVAETDQCRDDSTMDGKFDGRLMTRLMICQGAFEPSMTLVNLAVFPSRVYGAVVDIVNELNDPAAGLEEKDAPGKS